MVMPLRPDEWPIATDDERAAGWRDPRFDRRREAYLDEERLARALAPHHCDEDCAAAIAKAYREDAE